MAAFDWSRLPYRPLALLGEGGMGSVHRAFDPGRGREVAIKLLKEPGREQARLRLLREGALGAALEHPHLLALLAVHDLGDQVALVFELVPGARPLDQAWGHELPRRVELLRDAARGLAHAHARGIVHRDVKSANLLVDAAGRIRVADFGVGFSASEERLTLSGAAVGTPGTMAPEQLARAGDPTPRCDVWALGVLLYQALTDALPFPGPSLPQLADQVAAGLGPEHDSLLRAAPPSLVALVRACLQPDPLARPAHAGEVADRLEAWLADPQAAPATPPAPSGWRALGVAVLVVGLVAAGAWTLAGLGPEPPPVPPARGPLQGPAPSAPSDPAVNASVTRADERDGALREALRGPPGPARALAALELLSGAGPEHETRELAERVARELRRAPLVRLKSPAGTGTTRRQDWDVLFDPRRPEVLVGLLERAGLVVTWSLRTGEVEHTRRSARPWKLVRPAAGGALTLEDYEAQRGLWRVGLDGQDGWALPPLARPPVYDFAVSPAGTMFLLRGDAQVERREPGHSGRGLRPGQESGREVPILRPVRDAQICVTGADEVLLSLGDPQRDLAGLVRGYLPREGECAWRDLGEVPGSTCRLAGDPSSGRAAVAADLGRLELIERDGRRRALRPGGDPLAPLGVAWGPAGLWYHARPRDQNGHTLLELWDPTGAAPVATWQVGPGTKGVRPSPDGRFVALAHESDPPDGMAAEVWYVGPLPR